MSILQLKKEEFSLAFVINSTFKKGLTQEIQPNNCQLNRYTLSLY